MSNGFEGSVVRAIQRAIGDPKDQCYPASEAAWHILGPSYTPVRGGGHWWLRRPDGTVLDITAAQYPDGFDYSVGVGGGFLTKKPSRRAQAILDKVWKEAKTCPIKSQ